MKSKSTQEPSSTAPIPPGEPTVFVVDDDLSVRESLGNLLRSVGLKAELFHSAQEFLQRRHSAAGPGCLVLDVRLPGLSGLDLQAQLNKAGDRMPIIFITGHGDVPMSVRAMKGGAVEFLQKPFREQDLLDAIHQALALQPHLAEDPAAATPAPPAASSAPGPVAEPARADGAEPGPRQAIGRNIQMGRAIFSWSQEDLGGQCDLHRTHISALEREELSVGVDTVDRVAAAFGVPPHVLLMPPPKAQTLLLEAFNASGRKHRRTSRSA
ncbi:MAG: response regulator [Nevskia sp.]|nr:response regulator [Nevskia sp.]